MTGMSLFDKDRLFCWWGAVLIGWAFVFLAIGIPIFHILLGVSLQTVVFFVCIGCALQIAVTPLAFSARKTSRNPRGNIMRGTVGFVVWLLFFATLVLYYLQRAWSGYSQ